MADVMPDEDLERLMDDALMQLHGVTDMQRLATGLVLTNLRVLQHIASEVDLSLSELTRELVIQKLTGARVRPSEVRQMRRRLVAAFDSEDSIQAVQNLRKALERERRLLTARPTRMRNFIR